MLNFTSEFFLFFKRMLLVISTEFEILNLELFERLIQLLAVYMRVVSFLRAQI